MAAALMGLLTVVGVLVAPSSSRAAPAEQAATGVPALDERSRTFWVQDKHFCRSPWYAGRHRKMIGYGCTRAPYYPPSDRCRDDRGFHHGLDIHMACGVRLFAGFTGVVVRPSSAGALGPAYGSRAFRIRNRTKGVDVVIGHPGRVYVGPGERVRRGDLVARASDDGAPDGCHLHFETRPIAGSYTSAVRPHRYLDLSRARSPRA
ncbi:MAG: peptidoglycan DD-metalloendopeptidase family protein [Actinomycetota bacterium]|nr:peptidoglycan DD-metalloendopeptidase family protein [Actinomycetota bacterium]